MGKMKHAKYYKKCKKCKTDLEDMSDKFRGYCWCCWVNLPMGPPIIIRAYPGHARLDHYK